MGVDPHKKTHTAVATKETGEPAAEITVKARLKGFERLLTWARELDDERKFALEDCRHVSGSLGRHPDRYLLGPEREWQQNGKLKCFLSKRGELMDVTIAREVFDLARMVEAHVVDDDADAWVDRLKQRLFPIHPGSSLTAEGVALEPTSPFEQWFSRPRRMVMLAPADPA